MKKLRVAEFFHGDFLRYTYSMKFKQKTFTLLISVYVFFITLYFLALINKLFFFIWWYDIPLHILGGLWIGLTSIAVVLYSGHFRLRFTEHKLFFVIMVSVITLGVFWEFFEYAAGISFASGGYVLDTIKDLFDDLLGGIIAYIYFMRHFKEISHE